MPKNQKQKIRRRVRKELRQQFPEDKHFPNPFAGAPRRSVSGAMGLIGLWLAEGEK